LSEYKIVQKSFDLDDSVNQIEEHYDDLSPEQKAIFQPLFVTKDKDFHFYERLYYMPLSSNNS
jgi:hypothetical protein